MNNAQIFNLVLVVLFVVCNLFLEWSNTHKNKKNEWLDMMNVFANSYVHSYNQIDADGREKMKGVIASVKATMESKGKAVSPEDEKLIEAIAQSAYDKMTNANKTTNALNKLAEKEGLADALKTANNAETYEEDIDESSVTDFCPEVSDTSDTDAKTTDNKPETVVRHG